METDDYDLEQLKLEALRARLKASEEQAKNGQLYDGETVFLEILSAKYD